MSPREYYHKRVQRFASEIFLARHKCSWRSPVRRLLAAALRKKTFTFLPGDDSIYVECSKCGERESVTGREIAAWSIKRRKL